VGIRSGARVPSLGKPMVRFVRYSALSLAAGSESHQIEGVPVRVTILAKTVADCVKYRNKIGLDVALEALRECRRLRRATPNQIAQFAKVNRVFNVMRLTWRRWHEPRAASQHRRVGGGSAAATRPANRREKGSGVNFIYTNDGPADHRSSWLPPPAIVQLPPHAFPPPKSSRIVPCLELLRWALSVNIMELAPLFCA